MVATTMYHDRRIAVVQNFSSKSTKKHGIAKDTVTGELIYFNMSGCRKFTCSDTYPVFTDEAKHVEPNEGDAITFIIDPKPVQAGKRPCMLYWNYEESYQACLADCRKRTAGTNRDVQSRRLVNNQPDVKVTKYAQMTATNGHAHHTDSGNKNSHRRNVNHCARRRGKFRQAPGPENNWGYSPISSEGQCANGADVDLIKELTVRPRNH